MLFTPQPLKEDVIVSKSRESLQGPHILGISKTSLTTSPDNYTQGKKYSLFSVEALQELLLVQGNCIQEKHFSKGIFPNPRNLALKKT